MHHHHKTRAILNAARQAVRSGAMPVPVFQARLARIQAIQQHYTAQAKAKEEAAARAAHDAHIIEHRQAIAIPLRTMPSITVHARHIQGRKGASEVCVHARIPGKAAYWYIIKHEDAPTDRAVYDATVYDALAALTEDTTGAPTVQIVRTTASSGAALQAAVQKGIAWARASMHDDMPIIDGAPVKPILVFIGFWQEPHLFAKDFHWDGPIFTAYQCTHAEQPDGDRMISLKQLMEYFQVPMPSDSPHIVCSTQALYSVALAQTKAYT